MLAGWRAGLSRRLLSLCAPFCPRFCWGVVLGVRNPEHSSRPGAHGGGGGAGQSRVRRRLLQAPAPNLRSCRQA